MIPDSCDVLITHGPPFEILDWNPRKQRCGCADLRNEIFDRIRPQVHIFGHIHGAHGEREIDGIKFVNASVLSEQYMPVYHPIVVEIEHKEPLGIQI